VALVGDAIVIAAEARGSFVLDGRPLRCPSSPSVLVLGRSRDQKPRFAWCIASPLPFPSIAATHDGFAVGGRIAPGATVEAPVAADGASAPATGPQEISVLRFAADGTLRQRVVPARGVGTVVAMAATADGTLVVEGNALDLQAPGSAAQSFLVRVNPKGDVSDLEPRHEGIPSPTPHLLPRQASGFFRVAVVREVMLVEVFGADGSRETRARVPAPGAVVDLEAATGVGDDDLWLAWSLKTGRGDSERWERRLAHVGKTGLVNERSLGHEDVNAHVHGLLPLGADRAAVLFQVWKERGQRLRFGVFQLDPQAQAGEAVLVAYDVPGKEESAVAALGDDVTVLGVASDPLVAALTGWFRGTLRGPSGPALAQHACGMFVGTVSLTPSR
jgi:hypothetical protein